jgi:hypothetical protein
MPGQCIINLNKQLISDMDTYLTLLSGKLIAETVSKINAAQDQALQTKHHEKCIANINIRKCRLYQTFYEKIEHIIPACAQYLKKTVYKETCFIIRSTPYARKYGAISQ